jgi:hypothetical protein
VPEPDPCPTPSDPDHCRPNLRGGEVASLRAEAPAASYSSGGRSYVSLGDGYMRDPFSNGQPNTGILRIKPNSLEGLQSITLPISAFEVQPGVRPDRLYVRAFAHTEVKTPECYLMERTTSQVRARELAQRRGLCRDHYAFTNPVWAIETVAPLNKDCRSAPAVEGKISDAMGVWNDANSASFAVYPSNGSGFDWYSQWAVRQGGWADYYDWVSGDFTGDGRADVLAVWNNGNTSTLTVRRSLGGSLSPEHWYVGPFFFSQWTQWVPGDFTGDGRADVIAVWKDDDQTTFTLFRSNGNGFDAPIDMAVKDGGWNETTRWTVGDFDADGKHDLLGVWNKDRESALTVRRSNGLTLTHEHWAERGGTFFTSNQWLAGDFDGDGKDDAALIWKDGAQHTSVSVFKSTGSSFAGRKVWASRDAAWFPEARWTVGDYNRDGKADLLTVTPHEGYNRHTVRLTNATNNGFVAQQWADHFGGFANSTRWCSGAFR